MARDPRVLNFYVRQLQTRQRRRAGWPEPDNYGEMFLACLAIVLALSGFLWIYDELVHRDPLYVPAFTAGIGRSHIYSPRQTAREVPAPNMNSPAVARAEEDVPEALRVTATAAKAAPVSRPAHMAAARKRKLDAVTELPEAASEAYAAEPDFFRNTLRGF